MIMAGSLWQWLILATGLIIVHCSSNIIEPSKISEQLDQNAASFNHGGERLSCLPCKLVNCTKVEEKDCPAGLVKDVCGCCDVCAKGEFESCGGLFNFGGKCGIGLTCLGSNTNGMGCNSGYGACRAKICPCSTTVHKVKADATVLILPSTAEGTVKGSLEIFSTPPGILITGTITGLTPGKHGFHIHTEGKLTNNCKDAQGHFNPFRKNHGAPTDTDVHVGALGNIIADRSGEAQINIRDCEASLNQTAQEPQAFIGFRAIVIHAGEDDLGRGGDAGSLATGNAGSRAACGLICPEYANKGLITSLECNTQGN